MRDTDTFIDDLAALCVDWRPARKKGITPKKLRLSILLAVSDVMQYRSETAPAWIKDLPEHIDPTELSTLRSKANDYDNAMSIPLSDGSRLKIGEWFVEEGSYPFFCDGHENYNAKLCWDDQSKAVVYEMYPVSDRVSGDVCNGTVDDLDFENIVRRNPFADCKESAS